MIAFGSLEKKQRITLRRHKFSISNLFIPVSKIIKRSGYTHQFALKDPDDVLALRIRQWMERTLMLCEIPGGNEARAWRLV